MAKKKAAKTPDHAAELATNLVASLRTKKSSGDYPITLRQLAATADPKASPDVLCAAVEKPVFKKAAFLVKPPGKKNGVSIQQVMESPVGLWEDAGYVACHASTLAFVRAAIPSGAVVDWKRWVNGNNKGAFKKPFGESLEIQLGPEALAKSLVHVLRSQKRLGPSAYPLTVGHLAELTDRAPEADVATAVKKSSFSDAAVIAAPAQTNAKSASIASLMHASVALREDADLLIGTVAFLERALRQCRSENDQAFSIDDIARVAMPKWGTVLTERFICLTRKRLADFATPPTIGWIFKKGTPLLFLLDDLLPTACHTSRSRKADCRQDNAEASPGQNATGSGHSATIRDNATSPAVDDHFARRFEETFRRLDRDRGSNNFVWLADLRSALSEYTHEQFDTGLRRLREVRRYKINASEGHSGISSEQKQSSIYESGTLYLSVSRIES